MKGRRSRVALAFPAALLLGAALLGAAAPSAAHGGSDVLNASSAIYTVAWNRQGTQIAAGSANGNITLFDGVNHAAVKTWHAHDGPVNEVAFSPDGLRLASASGAYRAAGESTLKVWAVPAATLLLNITGHYDWVVSVAWSPDGALLASSSGVDDHENISNAYGEVLFWDAATGAPVWNASPLDSYPARIAWAPDGHALAAVGHLNDVWLLDPRASAPQDKMKKINHTLRDPVGHASHGWAAAWAPDSRHLAAGFSRDWSFDGLTDEGPVIIFDTQTLDGDGFALQVKRGSIHSKPAEWVAWDSTGSFVASCSGADLYDTRGTQILPGPDGQVDTGELVVYDWANSTGATLKGVNVFLSGSSWCSSVSWRPGNLTLAAGNADSTLRIYVLDEDGDGCYVWEDAGPQDPAVCKAVEPAPVPGFFDVWALPILGVGTALVATVFVLVLWRGRVEVAPSTSSSRKRDRERTGGRRRNSGRGR